MVAAPPVDDPLAAVESYCRVMAQTHSELETVKIQLESYVEHLHDAQAAADERFDLVSETLHALVSEAEGAVAAAAGDIYELGTTAHDVAGNRLAATGQGIDSAEERVAREIGREGETLASSQEDLSRDGFEASSSTLQAVSGDLATSEGALAHAFDDLAHTLAAQARQIEGAGQTAEQAFSAAGAELDQAEQAIGQSLLTAAAAWDSELTSQAEQAGATQAEAVKAAYAAFQQTAEQEGSKLVEEVAHAAQDAAERLPADVKDQIQAPYEQTTAPALETLEAALGQAQKALSEGEEICNRLEPLVRDLEIAKAKVSEVEGVLQAMA